MADGSGSGGVGTGAAATRRLRGHVKLGTRMWARVAREYAAGASAGWLSARYGAGERTIAARARAEGWRRKDLAEAADAELAAVEARGELGPAAGSAIGAGLGLGLDGSAGLAREAAAALAAALAAVTDEARAGAAREALDRAVAHMRTGDAQAATAWARLAASLETLAGTDGCGGVAEDPTEPGRRAAMEFLRGLEVGD